AGRSVRRDLATGLGEQGFDWDLGGAFPIVPIDLVSEDTSPTVYSLVEGEPLSASLPLRMTTAMARRHRCPPPPGARQKAGGRGGVPRHERPRCLRGRDARVRAHVELALPARQRVGGFCGNGARRVGAMGVRDAKTQGAPIVVTVDATEDAAARMHSAATRHS